MSFLPSVLLVGGPDVDARLELMHCLKDDFKLSAFGSDSTLHDKFLAEGFGYSSYNLSRGANPVLDLLTLSQLVLIFRRLKPLIVHTFDTKPGVWARLAARMAGVPIVIGTLPGLGSLYAADSWKTRIVRFIYERLQALACHLSDLTIFQNHEDARQLIAAGVVPKQKATVILGSGVPTNLFNPARVSEVKQTQLRNELGICPDEIVVTMVSRVIRSKGVLEFMVAAREVSARYPNLRFLLVGPNDDDSVDRLNSAELTQLKQTVIWPGTRRDIPVVLAISDIFVLPSAYREGIPRVLLEAASMGLPIVTTDSPGCNEVAKHGINGFLVGVRNPTELSRTILLLTEQPELRQRFGQASRRRAIEHFDLSSIADQTRTVYQQLLAYKGLTPAMAPNDGQDDGRASTRFLERKVKCAN